jgi:hypothetical protein
MFSSFFKYLKMKKLTNIFCFLLFVIILYDCKSHKTKKELELPEIEIGDAFSINKVISLDKFIQDSIEYIPLETNENCLIGGPTRVYVSNSNILVFSFRQIFLFDRTNGSFIREIGSYDKGPDGYLATLFCFPFDPASNKIYASGWDRSYVSYTLEGKFLKKYTRPEGSTSMGALNDSTLVSSIRNFTGNEKRRLVVYTKQDIINTFPNSNIAEPSTAIGGPPPGWFYRFGEELRYFEIFNDTIYRITEYELIPKYVFQMGSFAPPYEKQNTIDFIRDEAENYFRVFYIFESENFLVYEVMHNHSSFQGIYNKKTMVTYNSSTHYGFKNDIDDFLPLKYTSVSSQGELIGVLEAREIEQWFKDNPEKVAKFPPHLKKLKNITENDNPVVMIAKLKE